MSPLLPCPGVPGRPPAYNCRVPMQIICQYYAELDSHCNRRGSPFSYSPAVSSPASTCPFSERPLQDVAYKLHITNNLMAAPPRSRPVVQTDARLDAGGKDPVRLTGQL